MSAPPALSHAALPASIHATLNLLVIGVFGRAWLGLWLRLYGAGADSVRWTLHEELASAPPRQRWRRAIAFFAQLPQFASDQSQAESSPSTQTGGEPPQGPPPENSVGISPGRILRDGAFALVAVLAVVIALVTWISGIGTLFDLFDTHTVTGAATGTIAVSLIYGTLPLALVYNRRYFAWTPKRRAGRPESAQQRAGWWLATALFGLLALIVYVGVFAEYMDNFDWRGVDLSFGAALGMAAVALVGMGPLAWVARHRYWVGREKTPE